MNHEACLVRKPGSFRARQDAAKLHRRRRQPDISTAWADDTLNAFGPQPSNSVAVEVHFSRSLACRKVIASFSSCRSTLLSQLAVSLSEPSHMREATSNIVCARGGRGEILACMQELTLPIL